MFKKIMARKKLLKTRKTGINYSIDWSSTSSIIAIFLIIIGIIGIVSTFIFFSSSPAQCSTGPILSPNYIDFLIFGFGMISLMVGIAILYAGRQIK